jgi:hypothetical protein
LNVAASLVEPVQYANTVAAAQTTYAILYHGLSLPNEHGGIWNTTPRLESYYLNWDKPQFMLSMLPPIEIRMAPLFTWNVQLQESFGRVSPLQAP